jgi:hypothetical protein
MKKLRLFVYCVCLLSVSGVCLLLLQRDEIRATNVKLKNDSKHAVVQPLFNKTVVSLPRQKLLTTNSQSLASATAIHKLRQQHLNEVCNGLGEMKLPPDASGPSILVNRRLQVLYCQTGKVATSTWQRVLIQAAGGFSDNDKRLAALPHHIVRSGNRILFRLSSYDPKKLNKRFALYFKFMFVRHPFERLVSAYFSKFRDSESTYLLSHGRNIIRKYRHNATRRSLYHGHDVRFPEFVQYLINPRIKYHDDFHWRPFVDACLPCNVHYDMIGHYETLQQDADYVLNKLGVSQWLQFPTISPSKLNRSVELTRKMFADVEMKHIERLKTIYKADFELFEYDPNKYDH